MKYIKSFESHLREQGKSRENHSKLRRGYNLDFSQVLGIKGTII